MARRCAKCRSTKLEDASFIMIGLYHCTKCGNIQTPSEGLEDEFKLP